MIYAGLIRQMRCLFVTVDLERDLVGSACHYVIESQLSGVTGFEIHFSSIFGIINDVWDSILNYFFQELARLSKSVLTNIPPIQKLIMIQRTITSLNIKIELLNP